MARKCKEATRLYDQKRYAENKEAHSARSLAYRNKKRSEDPEAFKKAARNTQLKLKYGITLEVYDQMHMLQQGECAICGKTAEEAGPKGSILHVDHNHETGEVRALLCTKCNKGIGLLDDSPEALRSAADYLDRYGSYSK